MHVQSFGQLVGSIESALMSHYRSPSSGSDSTASGGGRPSTVKPVDIIKLLVSSTSLPSSPSLLSRVLSSPRILRVISVISNDQYESPRQLLPLLSNLPVGDNISMLVHNLPYKTESSSALIDRFEDYVSVAVESNRTSQVTAAASVFGRKLLEKSPANLKYVRENIIQSAAMMSLKTSSSPASPFLELDLLACTHTGEVEHALNLLDSCTEQQPSEKMIELALRAFHKSAKYDAEYLKSDAKLAQYYCGLLRSLAVKMGEHEDFRLMGQKVWRHLILAAGSLGDYDTAVAIWKAREIMARDLINEEMVPEPELEFEPDAEGGAFSESKSLTINPSDITVGSGVTEFSSSDYAIMISAGLTSPMINNIYGVLSDAVNVEKALVNNMEKHTFIDQTSVPGMSGMEAGLASMTWDEWDHGARNNRGRLKKMKFEGLDADDDVGTGRWEIAESWTMDEVFNKERFNEVNEAKELTGATEDGKPEVWSDYQDEDYDSVTAMQEEKERLKEQQERAIWWGQKVPSREEEEELEAIIAGDRTKSITSGSSSGGGDTTAGMISSGDEGRGVASPPPSEMPSLEDEIKVALTQKWEEDDEEDYEEITPLATLFNPPHPLARIADVKEDNDGLFSNATLVEMVEATRVPTEIGMDSREAILKRSGDAMALVDTAIATGNASIVVLNAGLSSLARTGDVEAALDFYESKYGKGSVSEIERDERTHRTILEVLLSNGRVAEALKLKGDIVLKGGSLDLDTYGRFLQYFGRRNMLGEGMRILEESVKAKGAAPKERYIRAFRGMCIRRGIISKAGDVNVRRVLVELGGPRLDEEEEEEEEEVSYSNNVVLKKIQKAKRYKDLDEETKAQYDLLSLISEDPKAPWREGLGKDGKRSQGKSWFRKAWSIRNAGLK